MKTTLNFTLALLLVACTNNTSYFKNESNNGKNTIVDFVLKYQGVPTPPAIGFKLVTKDEILLKEADFSGYKISIKGSIFDKADFIMTKPRIKHWYGDTILVLSQSSYFVNYIQNELDSIAGKSINEISLTIYKEQKSWMFRKSKE